jgi:hypothetical protein
MLSEWELWACANEAMVQYGKRAPYIAALRIAELCTQGDCEGVATWRHIASRIEALAEEAVGPAH